MEICYNDAQIYTKEQGKVLKSAHFHPEFLVYLCRTRVLPYFAIWTITNILDERF